MGSTLRNDISAALFLERIAKSWDKRRDLTLGQLLYESLQDHVGHDVPLDVAVNLRRLTDTQIAEAIERFVLRG